GSLRCPRRSPRWGEGSHGSVLNGNYLPNWLSSAWKPTHHLVVAEHFEHALKEREFTQIRERVFAAADVDSTSDPLALKWMD
ncbi:hypothetical protein, partial [Brucella anthropi]|uniref:hypothetical protein n=1 Tax=Brucella anthropi TaxID=529 RepID=UPI000AB17AC8